MSSWRCSRSRCKRGGSLSERCVVLGLSSRKSGAWLWRRPALPRLGWAAGPCGRVSWDRRSPCLIQCRCSLCVESSPCYITPSSSFTCPQLESHSTARRASSSTPSSSWSLQATRRPWPQIQGASQRVRSGGAMASRRRHCESGSASLGKHVGAGSQAVTSLTEHTTAESWAGAYCAWTTTACGWATPSASRITSSSFSS
mmetsp:Transcript_93155/g.208142  ORF Transcript_93155/g.208142 Transcript_93155/m.208142 type:complete len:200 (+) Transcript_93155:144-743(+)